MKWGKQESWRDGSDVRSELREGPIFYRGPRFCSQPQSEASICHSTSRDPTLLVSGEEMHLFTHKDTCTENIFLKNRNFKEATEASEVSQWTGKITCSVRLVT